MQTSGDFLTVQPPGLDERRYSALACSIASWLPSNPRKPGIRLGDDAYRKLVELINLRVDVRNA